MQTYTLPDLPYGYDALEPHISAETLQFHHDKHHAAYVKGANETLERLESAEEWQLPGLERSLSFNVSGHVLHSLFWESMSPETGQRPTGDLEVAVKESFGSFEALRERLHGAITTLQGSGWALLCWEPVGERLVVAQVRDHDGATVNGATAILAVDGWEHAFYIDHRNDKAAWVDAFDQVANWNGAGERLAALRG